MFNSFAAPGQTANGSVRYHDEEWGVPAHDDRTLFEFLILEGAQAGLSWNTILNKRENYRKAFDGFDPQRVARYDRRKIERLLRDPGIVRNKLKIACGGQQCEGISAACRKSSAVSTAISGSSSGQAARELAKIDEAGSRANAGV